MSARSILLLLVLLPACTASPKQLDHDYQQARLAMWRGEFADAEQRASHGSQLASKAGDLRQYWRFRLLSGEIAVLDRNFRAAAAIASSPLPEAATFDALRGRQRLLQAKLQIEQGNIRSGHELLAVARQSAAVDSDLALEVDRLDGQALLRMGEWKQGESLLNGVVTNAVAEGSHRYDQAMALNDLGRGLMARNRYDEALTYFERVTDMRDLSELSIYVLSSRNAGSCYQRLGQFDRAVGLLQQALTAQERRGKRECFVQALLEMGNLHVLRGEPDRGLSYLQRGLDEAKAAGLNPEGSLLAGNIASADIDLGRWDEAERYNQEGQRLWLTSHTSPFVYHVLNSARIAVGRGRYDEASNLLTQVLATPEAPPSVLWTAHSDLARVAIALKQSARTTSEFEAALRIIETTRAGLLRTDDKISYLTRLISFYQDYVSALIAQGQIERALEVADSSRGQLLAERQTTSAPGRVKAAAVSRIARESGVVMLSYWLAADKSWLWVVAPTGVRLLALPAAHEIETLVRQHQEVIANAMADPLGASDTAGDKLYQRLIAPAAQWIPKGTRVIIVPDGVLHEINFETLTVPGASHHYWIDDVQVELAPSLATLASPAPSIETRAPRLLLVGNPDGHAPDFPKLAHAAAEMSNIASHFDSGLVTKLDGDRASPVGYAEVKPEQFAYVHFTAHAATNRDSPLDSIVVLSGQEDRYKLYARTVAAQPLRARLVTISACRSAGDKAYTGEGLVGFSWAFLKAGARNVVAGLWDVDDSTTPQLMDWFYAGIAAGHAPGRALRDAKRAMIADGGAAAAPYRWAALELFTASLQ